MTYMKITRDTVTRMLAENGFSLGSDGDPTYDVIWLGNSKVGVLHDTHMYLSKEPNGYEKLIEFNDIYALSRIMARINALKHPAETEIRNKRVNQIRHYFETMKTKDKLSADLDSVSDMVDAVAVAMEGL